MAISEALIIGGGVIGLTIARQLHRDGLRTITVLERGSTGKEASWAAAGMLAPNAENDTHDDFYDLCAASCSMYPDFAAELATETGVDIELDRSGTLYLSFGEEDSQVLNGRYIWQREAGVRVERFSAAETLKAEPFVSPAVRESLFYPSDWQVESRALVASLKRYAELNGINVFENTEVLSLTAENNRVVGVQTANETFIADATVLATGAWTSLIKLSGTPIPIGVKPIRGQMISYHPPEKLIRRVVFGRQGYLVPRNNGRILAGATVEDVGFDRSATGDGANELSAAAAAIVPRLGQLKIADHWAGLRPFGANGLPILGELPGVSGMAVATAHFRNGILLAPITAKIIADKVVSGVDSKYLNIFGIKDADAGVRKGIT